MSGAPDALAAFKRQKTSAAQLSRKLVVSRQKTALTAAQIAHRKEVIDMLNDNEEDDNEYDSDGQVIPKKSAAPSRPAPRATSHKPKLTVEQIAHRKEVIDMLNDNEEDDTEYDSDGQPIAQDGAGASLAAFRGQKPTAPPKGLTQTVSKQKQKSKLTAEQIAHRKEVIDMLNDDGEDEVDDEYDSDEQPITRDDAGAGALAAFKQPVKKQKNGRNGFAVVL